MASIAKKSHHQNVIERSQELLLVSDSPLTRHGIKSILSGDSNLHISAEAATREAVLVALDKIDVDILVIEVSVRNDLGIRLIEQCKERCNGLRILALSNHDEWLYVGRILKAGAMGYVSKNATTEIIFDAVKHLKDGRNFVCPAIISQLLLQNDGPQGVNRDPISQLTAREFQIFELIGQGKTSRSIARMLGLSPHTVETYRERLKTKLNVGSGADLVFRAIVWTLLHT